MRLGSPQRPDLTKATTHTEINDKLVSTMNQNFGTVFSALRQNLSFDDNSKGKLYENFLVKHDTEVVIAHRLGQTVRNMVILGGDHISRGYIVSPGRTSSTCKFFLPNTAILDSVDNDIYVASPEGFKVNGTVEIDGAQTEIVEIEGNKISIGTTVSFSNLQSLMYVPSTNINFFIF